MVQDFVRNAWYVAAIAEELGAKPLARQICGEHLVLFRRHNGAVAALEDRCPHRKAPLSRGEVVDNEIQCGYHGVKFDGSGACTLIPSQPTIPRGFHARAFPVVERHGLIFVWTGEPAKADPALIPDWSKNTETGWTAIHGYHHVKGHYQLVLDNLLDLTHTTYLHKTTLAGPGVDQAPLEVFSEGDRLRTRRVIRNTDPVPLHRAIRDFPGKIDRFQITEFFAPIYIHITLGAQDAGISEELKFVTHLVLNSATPETDRTTHYFWSVTRNFAPDDTKLSETFKRMTYEAFDEDAVMIAAQQAMIDADAAGKALTNFVGDKAGFEARRITQRHIEAERGMAAVA